MAVSACSEVQQQQCLTPSGCASSAHSSPRSRSPPPSCCTCCTPRSRPSAQQIGRGKIRIQRHNKGSQCVCCTCYAPRNPQSQAHKMPCILKQTHAPCSWHPPGPQRSTAAASAGGHSARCPPGSCWSVRARPSMQRDLMVCVNTHAQSERHMITHENAFRI